MKFQCPVCGESLQVPDAATGLLGSCNKCGAQLMSPAGPGQPAILVSRKPAPAPQASTPDYVPPPYSPPLVEQEPVPGAMVKGDAALSSRIFGLLMDLVVIGVILVPTMPLWKMAGNAIGDAFGGVPLLAFLISDTPLIITGALYGAVMESTSLHATVGKLMTGSVVVDDAGEGIGFGKALLRNLVKWFSLIWTGGLAGLWIVVSGSERSLHDITAGTYVIEK